MTSREEFWDLKKLVDLWDLKWRHNSEGKSYYAYIPKRASTLELDIRYNYETNEWKCYLSMLTKRSLVTSVKFKKDARSIQYNLRRFQKTLLEIFSHKTLSIPKTLDISLPDHTSEDLLEVATDIITYVERSL